MKTGLKGLKPKNGLTKREFILVALLFIVLEGYLLFAYILQPAFIDYTAAEKRLESTRSIYKSLKTDFTKKSEMEKQLKEIDEKLGELTAQIPSYISQEEVILLVDSLSRKNSLSVQLISFDNADALPASVAPAAAADTKANTDSVQGDAVNIGNQAAQQQTAPTSPTLMNQDITLNFSGTYGQIYGLLTDIERNLRKVAVRGISLQKNEDDELIGQMKLSFVSYWDASNQQPYTMEVSPAQGKDNLFIPYLGYSASANKGSPVVKPLAQPDFSMMLNGYMNNADKVVLYQYPKAETTVAADANDVIKASVTLNGNDGSFTYSYTVGGQTKATQDAIKIRDGKIRLEVLVQKRTSNQDKVAVVLDVANNTDRPFEITVSGDDKQNPRFKLGKTTGNIVVK